MNLKSTRSVTLASSPRVPLGARRRSSFRLKRKGVGTKVMPPPRVLFAPRRGANLPRQPETDSLKDLPPEIKNPPLGGFSPAEPDQGRACSSRARPEQLLRPATCSFRAQRVRLNPTSNLEKIEVIFSRFSIEKLHVVPPWGPVVSLKGVAVGPKAVSPPNHITHYV